MKCSRLRSNGMLPFGVLLIALSLLPLPVQAREESPAPLSWCLEAKGAPSPGYYLLSPKEEPAPPLLTTGPQKKPDSAGVAERLKVTSYDDLLALNFSTPTPFTPWFGAGIDLENGADSLPAYRLGLGFGCALGSLTRLHFGYGYSSLLDLLSGDLTAPEEDEERHRFTFGLEKSF